MTTNTFDDRQDPQARDFIRKFIKDGKTEKEALTIWKTERGICPRCGADRRAYLAMMHRPCKEEHGEMR